MQNVEIQADFVRVEAEHQAACVLLFFRTLPRGTVPPLTFKEINVMHARALVDRVRGEFNEMPGLQLTIPQAARLLGIEHDACRDVIETLVASSFLRKTSGGMVVRAER